MKSRIIFKPRNIKLLKLEGNYDSFILSCRHKDMLRCSASKHFRSCYAPDGFNSITPYELCSKPNYAIIGKKDKSGDFLWRAFIFLYSDGFTQNQIKVYKIYGNPPRDITSSIFDSLPNVSFCNYDATGI